MSQWIGSIPSQSRNFVLNMNKFYKYHCFALFCKFISINCTRKNGHVWFLHIAILPCCLVIAILSYFLCILFCILFHIFSTSNTDYAYWKRFCVNLILPYWKNKIAWWHLQVFARPGGLCCMCRPAFSISWNSITVTFQFLIAS